MSFIQILPALITLIIGAIGGLLSFNKQQARFDGELDLIKQQLISEKERLNAEIIAIKIVNDHLSKTLDHTKEEMGMHRAVIQKIETNIEFIKEMLKEIRDKR
jgi:hypothetical protein